ncbi:MAG: nuclear transport factor 2 family protein [Solirubrobacterales bacterium]
MSTDPIERVREGFEALASGGVEALSSYLDPEIELIVSSETSLEPGTYRGLDGVRRYFGSWDNAMGAVEYVPEEIDARGDRVLVELVFGATGSGSGIQVSQRGWVLVTLADNLVKRIEEFPDRDSAAKALDAG